MNDSRERFESHIIETKPHLPIVRRFDGGYENVKTNTLWQIWQEAQREPEARCANLTAMVMRLANQIRKKQPKNAVAEKAIQYLTENKLIQFLRIE